MEIFFTSKGASKKLEKRAEIGSVLSEGNSAHNKIDIDRFDQESDIRRGEHYNRQRRRSRYFAIKV